MRLPSAVKSLIGLQLVCGSWGLASCSLHTTCQPAALHINPLHTVPGATVRVSSPAASCSLDLGSTAHYRLRLLSPDARLIPLGTAPVAADGRFETRVRIPSNTPAGRGAIWVDYPGHPFCNDQNNSCPGYRVKLTIDQP